MGWIALITAVLQLALKIYSDVKSTPKDERPDHVAKLHEAIEKARSTDDTSGLESID